MNNETDYIKTMFLRWILANVFLLMMVAGLFSQTDFNADSILKNSNIGSSNPQVDSLILSLENIKSDVVRLETLYAICEQMVSGNADKCIAYGSEGLQLAEKLGDLYKQHSLSLWVGVSYDDKGRYSNAIEMYSKSFDLLKKLESDNEGGLTDYFSKEAILLNNIGYAYFNIGIYDESLKYYLEGLEIAKEKSPGSKATILGSICELYFEIGDMDKAYEYGHASLECSEDPFDITLSCRMLGDIFEYRKQPDSSFFYYNKSFEASKNEKDNYLIGIGAEGLVNYHLARGNYEQVIDLANYALAVAEALNGVAQMVSSNLALATASLNLGQEQAAFKHAEKALAISMSTNNVSNLPDCYAVMESIYLKKKDYQKAYSYRKEIQLAKEEVFNSEKLRLLTEAESLQKLKKKENENQLLKANQAKNVAMLRHREALNFAFLSALGLAGTLLFFLFKNYRAKKVYNDHLKKEVAEQTIALTNSNIELERFNHIISHDLKGPLRNIVSFSSLSLRKLDKMEDNDLKEYLTFIKKAAIQLNSLIEDVREFTSLEKNLPDCKPVDLNNLLNNVIETLTLEINEKNANIKKQEGLPVIQSHSSLLFILYKNIIENGIKYNKSEVPEVNVSYNEESEDHVFTICDNGIGIPTEQKEEAFVMFKRLHHPSEFKGTGMGLAICKKVTEKLGGQIEIVDSSKKGTTFSIRIPKVTQPNLN